MLAAIQDGPFALLVKLAISSHLDDLLSHGHRLRFVALVIHKWHLTIIHIDGGRIVLDLLQFTGKDTLIHTIIDNT